MHLYGGYPTGFPAPAGAEDPRLLRVVGEGRLDAPPDSVSVWVGVSARASQATAAYQQAATAIGQIVQAMLNLGIPREQLQTGQISLQPIYEQNRLVGYEASATIKVTVRDVSQAGAVVDRAVAAGANNIQGVQFELADPAAYASRALTLAVQDAQRKATTLANSLGVQLGPVYRAEEETAGGPIPLGARAVVAEAIPVLPGTLPVVHRVLVEYLIR